VIELTTCASVVWLYLRYGASPLFLYLVFVSAILILTGAIDWLHRWIYTFTMLGGAAAVLAAASFVRPHNLMNATLGLLAAGFIFIVFYILARVMFPAHRAPFGLGDVYLAMFIGGAFGLTRLAPVLFGGMLLAGIFSVIVILRTSRMGRSSALVRSATSSSEGCSAD
jgi:leader peptidase (prepilin peptidase) / N-methyltransferase